MDMGFVACVVLIIAFGCGMGAWFDWSKENSPKCPNCGEGFYNLNLFENNCDECGYRETNERQK